MIPGQVNYERVLQDDLLTWRRDFFYSVKKFNSKEDAKNKLKELYENGKVRGFGSPSFYIKEIIEFY